MKKRYPLLFLLLALLLSAYSYSFAETKSRNEDAVLEFLNLKFGMFIHYNMSTYDGKGWAYPFHDPKEFKPSDLDCNQWARGAKSAGMQYAVFTAKHHDGFCLWDTRVTNYDIASSEKEYKDLDIVKKYADAFRKAGITVGLYFSVWDRHHGIEHGNINEENINFTKQQLTELLTNYGEINCIVIDGWGSKWGKGPDFEELPYHILADHIHSLQPNCLVINHACRADLDVTQIVHYEATHGQHIPYDNTFPSQQGPVMQPGWFWKKGFDSLELKPVQEIVNELAYTNQYLSNYLLNAAPNDRGFMDDNVMQRLAEVGKRIEFSEPHKSLPKVTSPHQHVSARASSTLMDTEIAAQNVLDCHLFTAWKAAENDASPWLELDFGKPETFNFLSMHGGYKKTIQEYEVEALLGDKWKHLFKSGPATFHEKQHFEEVTAQKYRLKILKKKGIPEIVEMTFVHYE